MGSFEETDSEDFSLEELGDEWALKKGPRIDTSEEFPLPSLGIDGEDDFALPTPTSIEEEWIDLPDVGLSSQLWDDDLLLDDDDLGDVRHSDTFEETTRAHPEPDHRTFGISFDEEPEVAIAPPVVSREPYTPGADDAPYVPGAPNLPGAPEAPRPPAGREALLAVDGGKKKRPLRAWIPAAGVVLLAGAYIATRTGILDASEMMPASPVLIVASHPQGELFSDDESLGMTPVALMADRVTGELKIHRHGYQSAVINADLSGHDPDKPPLKQIIELQPEPVPLRWDGLSDGGQFWLDGQPITPQSLSEISVGSYSLKVKFPNRPSVIVGFNAEAGQGGVPIAELIREKLAQQPQISVLLAASQGYLPASTTLTVRQIGEGTSFSTTLPVTDSGRQNLVVPEAGTYKIAFSGNSTFQATSSVVEVASGASIETSLSLQPVPKVVEPVAPAANTYTTSEPYYPPPVYQPYYPPAPRGGGGGGGGQIAPPSF